MAASTPTTFGAWLRAQRKEQDLTQEALSERAGCSSEMVRKIEASTARPSRQLAELLAAALGVPPAERAGFVRWARTGQPDQRADEQSSGGGGSIALPNPYKGLRAFQEADAPDFFGREALTAHLLTRLAEDDPLSRFLAVVGPSGSGKSSVVRAGLVPALRHNGVPGSARWTAVEVVPGPHPFDELEVALLRYAINPPPSLMPQLREDDRGLLRAVKRSLPADPAAGMLLLIDQFEELFTLVEDETTRRHFLSSLYAAVTEPRSPLRVVVTLRADFYDRPLLYNQPAALLGERTEIVPPMAPDELERAIVGPAGRAGVSLEPQLLAALIADTGSQPGMLPLLQYALTELFEQRDGLRLTLGAYQRSGGVTGTLGRRADALYAAMTAAEQAETRQLFLRLITLGTLGDGIEDTRRRVRRSELASAARNEEALDRVLEGFGQARLLTFDRDPASGVPTVEVAHEALLGSWERLRSWLDASRDSLRVQRRLLVATGEWAAGDQDQSYLASGARLAQFEALAAEGDLALTEEERGYLAASLGERRRQEQAEYERQSHELELAQQSAEAAQRAAAESQRAAAAQRSAANRLRGLVIALALFLLVAAALTLFAFDRSRSAERNATEANTQRLNAQIAAQTAVASEQQAQADFKRSEAQRLAAEANVLVQTKGNSEQLALLALRSINTQYTTQGDAALQAATTQNFPIRIFTGHTSAIQSVVFSPDGRQMVTSSWDKTVRLWDPQTGKQLRIFEGHEDQVNSVFFSPDGSKILSVADDKTARLWDVATGKQLRILLADTGPLFFGQYSPDGKYILIGSLNDAPRLFDAATMNELRRFSASTELVLGAAFSPDGQLLATSGSGKVARLWDVQTGKLVRTFEGHTDLVNSVAFSPDGKHLLTASYDKTARTWDVQTGKELTRFTGHTNVLFQAVYSPSGNYVLTASSDRTARLWDATTGEELRRLSSPGSIYAVAFSPDGKYMVAPSRDGSMRMWAVQDQTILPRFTTSGRVISIFSPDGKFVLTTDAEAAHLWDAQSGTPIRDFRGHINDNSDLAFSPDGKYVLTAQGNSAELLDTSSGSVVSTFSAGTEASIVVYGLAFSPDGKSVLVGGNDKTLRLWDIRSGKEVLHLVDEIAGGSGIVSLAFSPDGAFLMSGGSKGSVNLWDAHTGMQIRSFVGHVADFIQTVDFSHDGRYAVTAGADGARLWDVQTGAEVRHFSPGPPAYSAMISPDGKYLLGALGDNTARLWDTTTGAEVRRFSGHTLPLVGAQFSPDGKLILTTSADGTARLWRTELRDDVDYLCSRLLRDFTDEERTAYNIEDQTPTCPNR